MLTRAPIGFEHPYQWSGFIPSQWVPDAESWVPNHSPTRRALIEILETVARLDDEAAQLPGGDGT
jgi:hypothetical protein